MDMQYRPSHSTLAGTTLRPDANMIYSPAVPAVPSLDHPETSVPSPVHLARQPSGPAHKSLAGTTLRPTTPSGISAPEVPEMPCHIRPLKSGHISMAGTSLRPDLDVQKGQARSNKYTYKQVDHLQGSGCSVGEEGGRRHSAGELAEAEQHVAPSYPAPVEPVGAQMWQAEQEQGGGEFEQGAGLVPKAVKDKLVAANAKRHMTASSIYEAGKGYYG